ncbi:MAG: tRNA lysidine(34) synthetase TilS [Candidatus Omnitrophica bacterium]|nr:tRNA lysidine(34) synthetase TilS [Candidatus Omnitrophota bacterium]
MSLLNKFLNTIKRYRLIDKGEVIVIGVSGGPDSLALLYLLQSLKRKWKLKLHLAHLDHMLRKDSHKDREFVEKLAEKLRLPFTGAQINVKELASQGGSLEEIARNARLGFLFKVAGDTRSKKIALGHNLDDQAETVLMRILRGSGLYGLSAILPKRDIRGYQIIRPLIEISRRGIESFLKKKKIKPLRDASNLKDIYFRNRIRNRLLPLLEKEYNKNIKELLCNLAESSGLDYDYLNRITEQTSRRLGQNFNLKKFRQLHPAVQRMLLRRCIRQLKGDTRRLTLKHIKEIEDLVFNRPVNSVVDLPLGLSVVKKKNSLCFYLRKNR